MSRKIEFKEVIIKGIPYESYIISNTGEIYSLKFGKKKLMSQHVDGSGYKYVSLFIHGKLVKYRTHIAVASAFIGTIKQGQIVNHRDCNKENNTVENLEIISQSENMVHWWDNKAMCKMNRDLNHAAISIEESVSIVLE